MVTPALLGAHQAQLDPTFWRQGEPANRCAAVVCARGHVVTSTLDQVPGPVGLTYGFCDADGTPLLARCATCGVRIKGEKPPRRLATYSAYMRPSFCDCCSAAHPWATREDRMEQLQHIAGAEPDPDRRAAAIAALEQLKGDGLRGRREAKLWATVQRYTPEVLAQGGRWRNRS